ncbi:hypothetical protein K2173_003942 [Erythroxylum novogranatense]|uniref:Uncharacterized protein n=1 Tax=Erythroxylum novogranatense TaxID=1862640 RepID=A0AAV8SJ55_9ROSI|nr:hypothetical protein K2173_003942 [Erythroxylum novogranatense]
MASSSPPPPPPPHSPPSASNSVNSAPNTITITTSTTTLPSAPKVEEASENGVPVDQKPDLSHLAFLDSEEYIEKFRRYEADYTRRLMKKYFSKKNIYGGNIFDEKSTIDDETIMSSRLPCMESYADPVKAFEELSSTGSSSTSET